MTMNKYLRKTNGRLLFSLLTVSMGVLLMSLKPAVTGNFPFSININQADTTNTGSIAVQLGSTDGASDLLNYTFNYDVKSGLPSGLAYSRTGKNITLTLGSFTSGVPMYGQYTVLNKSGQSVLTKKFIYK